MKSPESSPVLIVGAGPTGATLALLLARVGVRSQVFEQRSAPQKHPAACILSNRTMEVFRQLRLDDEILANAQDIFVRSRITWVESLAGRELASFDAMPEDKDASLAQSQLYTTLFPQNRLEPILWERLEGNSLVEFHRGAKLQACRQSGNFVSAQFEPASRRTAEYLIGCDGSSSAVRECSGIAWEGPVLQPMISVHFRADLGPLVNHRKSILYWVFNRKLLGVLIAHWLPTEWVLMTPFFPPQESTSDFDHDRCTQMIHTAVGTRVADIEIQHVGAWRLMSRSASSYRKDRIFLAGDAAHSFPPTGGLGLNTGVHDAHNLAWKLTMVLRKQADPRLLDTYETERLPVGTTNVAHSTENFHKEDDLLRPSGLGLKHLRTFNRVLRSSWFQGFPQRLQKWLLKTACSAAFQRLSVFAADSRRGTLAREQLCREVPKQESHYRFPGLDLGVVYRTGAIASESSSPQEPQSVTTYTPTTLPGARLPHFWVTQGTQQISTHDLIDMDALTLLVGATAKAWHAAVAVLKDGSLGIHRNLVKCVSIAILDSHAEAQAAKPPTYCTAKEWRKCFEIGVDGALLVRPDCHVAWRAQTLPNNPATELKTVLIQVIGKARKVSQ